ncbi:MAG: nucleoside deaminase [Qipengyuania pacifica]
MASWTLPQPMHRALALAEDAARVGEVPVGAVIVRGGTIVAEAHNAPREHHDPTAHAEIRAIRLAARNLGEERLTDCELWVTLEPCAMCAGAIVHARIGKLYYAASDPKGGAVEHGARVFDQPQCLHKPEIYSGMGEAKAAQILREFFRQRR